MGIWCLSFRTQTMRAYNFETLCHIGTMIQALMCIAPFWKPVTTSNFGFKGQGYGRILGCFMAPQSTLCFRKLQMGGSVLIHFLFKFYFFQTIFELTLKTPHFVRLFLFNTACDQNDYLSNVFIMIIFYYHLMSCQTCNY